MADAHEIARRGSKLKDLDPRGFSRTRPRVRELTVDDLHTLARLAESPTAQAVGTLATLTADDLKSIDDAMHEARLQAGEVLARRLAGEHIPADDETLMGCVYASCCCTPCCCCAAADVDPFE